MAPVLVPADQSPRSLLLGLLAGVQTIQQSDDWAAEYRTAAHLLTREDQIDLAAKAAAARFRVLMREA